MSDTMTDDERDIEVLVEMQRDAKRSGCTRAIDRAIAAIRENAELRKQHAADVEIVKRHRALLDEVRAELAAAKQAVEANREAWIKLASECYDAWQNDSEHRVGKMLKAMSGLMPGYRADIDAVLVTASQAAAYNAAHPNRRPGWMDEPAADQPADKSDLEVLVITTNPFPERER